MLIIKGVQTAAHKSAATNKASITAALPKSFALLERSWCSNEMRSIAASTLELRSSTTNTMIKEVSSNDFSNRVTGNAKAMGASNTNRASSCLKALSSKNA